MAFSLLVVSTRFKCGEVKDLVRWPGFHVRCYARPSSALQAAIASPPDVVLLDAGSDPVDSLQICRSFRSEHETQQIPLVVLCGRASAGERLALLEAGADDCWTEPLESRECLLRLRAMARRFDGNAASGSGHILRYADVELDIERFKVRRNGRVIALTSMQMKLLRHFMEHPAIVFSRRQLLEQLWDNRHVDEGAVTACVIRLRHALNTAGPNIIRIVPSSGYALDSDLAAADG